MGARSAESGLAALEARIGHRFRTPALLQLALTHVSAADGPEPHLQSYQRLEFLGDRVLGLCVSAMLYDAFPQAQEGDLSRRLADLVRWETCAEVAAEWRLDEHLRLGGGARRGAMRRNAAALADACEAVIGAVFLDAGFSAACAVVDAPWRHRMLERRAAPSDPKTALQEWAQRQGLPVPLYRETARSGPDHAPRFHVAAEVAGLAPAEGAGASKRAAERAAAELLLKREGVWS